MARICDVTIRTPSACGSAPPDSPVPEPRATYGTPASAQARTTTATWSVFPGSTTSAGHHLVLGEPVALVRPQLLPVGQDTVGRRVTDRKRSARWSRSMSAPSSQGIRSYAGKVRNSAKSSESAISVNSALASSHGGPDGSSLPACWIGPSPQSTSRSTRSRVTVSPVGELDLVVQPLPDLGPGDLRRCGVLHQVVDGDRAAAAKPGLQVLDADADVVAQPGLGDLARRRGDVEQLRRGHLHVLAQLVELVRTCRRAPRRTPPCRRRPCRGGRPRSRRNRRWPPVSCRRAPSRSACSLTCASLLGMNAAMPPIACAPRLWQVRTSSSV